MTAGVEASPVRGVGRAVRAGVLGGASLLLAGSAHLIGGGALPTPGVLVVVAALVGLTAVTITGRRCRLPLLLGVLGLQQLLLHYLFDLVSASSAVDAACATSGPHHLMTHGCWSASATTSGAGEMGWAMVVAHAVAVLATAALLARGEAWFWRVADRIVAAASAQPSGWPPAPRALVVTSPELVPPNFAYAPAAPRGPPAR